MPSTTNFGWTTPADTDLVKDGAAAIRTLGNGIDSSFVDLKGGTTGQVLSKNSNTDLDFTWVAQDDSNAIQNALLTTTGDTIYASSASTPARLGIGSTGQVLTVSGGVPVWATPAGGGKVLQVVYGSTTTITDVTSSTVYADTSLSATITPSATSSKVLIITSQTALIFSASLLSHGSRIVRGSTVVFTGGVGSDGHIDIGSYGNPLYLGDRFTMTYLDSPSTTSATTYKTQGIRNYGNTLRYQAGNYESTMILMEIGA
jgi:hypothetical protein